MVFCSDLSVVDGTFTDGVRIGLFYFRIVFVHVCCIVFTQ